MNLQNYTYAPVTELAENFKCGVPMKGTRQVFVIDGGVQGTGKPLSVSFDKNAGEDILQVIGVRTDKHPEEISFENNYNFQKGVRGRLILCSHTYSMDPFITNEVINLSLEEGAVANVVVMQNEHNKASHTSTFNIKLAADSAFTLTVITLHGGELTNNITVNLNGRHADCDINGIYLMDGKQIVRNNLNVIHNVPECSSRQLFKGILDDESESRFFGLIKVVPDAQKTEAYQENHNLILTNKVKAYSEPQLEIYADDVKCSHGATNGRLDENELFYMRSRGIPLKEARILQQLAFAHAVINKISSEELKDTMMQMIEQRLRGEITDCQNCNKNCY